MELVFQGGTAKAAVLAIDFRALGAELNFLLGEAHLFAERRIRERAGERSEAEDKWHIFMMAEKLEFFPLDKN